VIAKPASQAPVGEAQPLAQQTSVIVVAHNTGCVLGKCVASILETAPGVEVVIVDNASNDNVAHQLDAAYPEVVLVRNATNVGFGGGGNAGAACTDRPFLVFLNPDALVSKGWLEVLVRPLVVDASLGLVTPKVLCQAVPEKINVAGLDVHLSGISMCRGLGMPRSSIAVSGDVAAISGVAFAVRHAVFEHLGGFDPAFFLYMEDVDISLRAWLAGYRCGYVPQPVVVHDYDTIRMDGSKTFWVERGRYLMLLKAFRWRTLFALLPLLLLTEVMTWGWTICHNRQAAGQKLRAWHWVLDHWPEVREKRRAVQARRRAPDAAFLRRCTWQIELCRLGHVKLARVAQAIFTPLLWCTAAMVWLLLPEGEKT
jgi:GT2 family glycosyltransferase